MEIAELQIGDNIEVELITTTERLSFPSTILEILKDGRILISEISHEAKSIGFSKKGTLYFLHKGEKIHRWENPSITLVKYKNQIYHCVMLYGIGELYNRRDAYRVYIGLDCTLSIATPAGLERYEILLKDISTGGAGFILSNKDATIPLHKKVRINLKDEDFDLILHLEVLRLTQLEDKDATLYGCRHINPQILVNRYIMHKQGKKLKEMRS